VTTAAARLRFVAGKGGVGRTTIAAARTIEAVRSGRKTLAVDATGSGDLARLLAGFSDDPDPGADPNPTVLTLTTVDALDHYLSLYLPVPGLTGRAVGPSGVGPLARIFEYVATAAPGVREILVVGKIAWEARSGGWDEVIVDSPATGHLVELLDAPRSMAELVPVGPIAEQSAWLRELLAAASTTVELVTTLDELPVTETLELADRLRSQTSTSLGALILNRVPIEVGRAGAAEAQDWARRAATVLDAPAVSDAAVLARAELARLAVERSASAAEQRERLGQLASSVGSIDVPDAPSPPTTTAVPPTNTAVPPTTPVLPEVDPLLDRVAAALSASGNGDGGR
jgi:anion-transporting  ArsA/GET3 family ATPase